MGRRYFANRAPLYNSARDVGLYVISNDDMLMENVNRVLERRGIIGITDATGSVRYFVDGRREIDKTVERVKDAVTDYGADCIANETPERDKMMDAVAHKVFVSHGFDFSLIGSHIIYVLVWNMLDDEDCTSLNLKELCMASREQFDMSYNQMVRNMRYAISKSEYKDLRSRAALRHLCFDVKAALAYYRKMKDDL
ncbi:MAG: hypothetical protein K6A80_10955 [Saccharofermentans sp.]|nr:hypothetical protein [Saccharofermentans sp.]